MVGGKGKRGRCAERKRGTSSGEREMDKKEEDQDRRTVVERKGARWKKVLTFRCWGEDEREVG